MLKTGNKDWEFFLRGKIPRPKVREIILILVLLNSLMARIQLSEGVQPPHFSFITATLKNAEREHFTPAGVDGSAPQVG